MDRIFGLLQRVRMAAFALVGMTAGFLAFAPPAVAQLDTMSQFYMPGRFCMWDSSGAGVWMCSGPPVALAPPKPDVWGAIAISPNLEAGMSWNWSTQAAAEADALKRCNSMKYGACKVASIVVDVCVALAVSAPDHIYRLSGESGAVNLAEDRAVLLCRKAGGKACKLKTSFCADGVRHELTCKTEFHNGNPVCVEPGSRPFGRRG